MSFSWKLKRCREQEGAAPLTPCELEKEMRRINDKQIRPVKTKDFQVGDKVVTERLGHVVVKEIYEDCVRVQASDGRFFDVLPTALCFEAGYKRQNTEHKDKNSGDREMK